MILALLRPRSRRFLTRLRAFHDRGQLAFFGSMIQLAERRAFLRHLSPVRKKRWVVYAKLPFAGPEAVLAYLSRYTHRVAISNSRLLRFDDVGVTFRYKDYRSSGVGRQQIMTLAADEFIRRFLLHALPRGFHRIRHYGLLDSARRKDHLERARRLLNVAPPSTEEPTDLPVLRRYHDHHRGLRAPLSAPRAATAIPRIRDTSAMIRHGLAPTRSSAHLRLQADPLAPALLISGHRSPKKRTFRLSASAFATHIQTVRYRARPLLGSTYLPTISAKQLSP